MLVRLSVRLSVCLTRVLCDLFKEHTGDIFIPRERAIILVFCHLTVVGGRRPFHLKWAIEVTHPFKNRSRRQISACHSKS